MLGSFLLFLLPSRACKPLNGQDRGFETRLPLRRRQLRIYQMVFVADQSPTLACMGRGGAAESGMDTPVSDLTVEQKAAKALALGKHLMDSVRASNAEFAEKTGEPPTITDHDYVKGENEIAIIALRHMGISETKAKRLIAEARQGMLLPRSETTGSVEAEVDEVERFGVDPGLPVAAFPEPPEPTIIYFEDSFRGFDRICAACADQVHDTPHEIPLSEAYDETGQPLLCQHCQEPIDLSYQPQG